MEIVLKVIGYFFLWTLYSYICHVIAHVRFKYNFLQYFHMKHHAYNYDDTFWPPWHDYFFWFGDFRSSMDVYFTFTLPLIVLTFFDPVPGAILLAFHYVYEVFLSRTVLDHNPKITGKITRFIPIGSFHLKHHTNVRCNFSFYITLWDYLFKTDEKAVKVKRQNRRLKASQAS
ncbi:sterol desaturase family protein [Vibrio tritonius]|uniref:sterol desaturase family protein n=1 Tax=Vibrio tritonius TaxID=1435069 RepID=UPI000838501F|nr:sterol desaturase family protein [Vibrio tritonius]